MNALFEKSFTDGIVWDVIAEHAVDHVAEDVGEPGDFAVANLLFRGGIGKNG